ncbi:MAG: siderophore-interacting protein [Bacteroidota bacterium]
MENRLTVKATELLSPNMRRITFEGEHLKQLSTESDGAYVKLQVPSIAADRGKGPKMRPYTIRKVLESRGEIFIDFALHEPAGPATAWALQAKVGDEIGMKGPGPKRFNDSNEGWYLFAADMSAIPAAIASIERLPAKSTGIAFFEIVDKKDMQEVAKPAGVSIQWIINEDPHKENDKQLSSIRALEIPEDPNVFVAGENSTVRKIKEHLMKDAHFQTAKNVYMSSFWKVGKVEEDHKIVKVSYSV